MLSVRLGNPLAVIPFAFVDEDALAPAPRYLMTLVVL
jgi:hypothetical protein